ncbi:hypothetical protein ACFL39_00835 [Gemmatimonadota bacterium]
MVRQSKFYHVPLLAAALMSILVLTGGCDELPTDLEISGELAEVVFHIAWPSPHLARSASIPTQTTDIAVRIAQPWDSLKKGTTGHITNADTSITMMVEPGADYVVEVLCAYEIADGAEIYAPIGYGITKGLTLSTDSTNYVSVDVDTIDLVFSRTDTLAIGETLSIELSISVDDSWGDFTAYVPDKLNCILNDPDKVIGNSIKLEESSRDASGAVLAWESVLNKGGGIVDFFVKGAEGDKLTALTDAFGLDIQAAWNPADFGESGDKYSIYVIEGALVVVTIPKSIVPR